MSSHHHNPERSSWKGRSYRKGGKRVREIRAAVALDLRDRIADRVESVCEDRADEERDEARAEIERLRARYGEDDR